MKAVRHIPVDTSPCGGCVQAEVSAAAATVAALSGERDSHRAAAEEAVQRANVSAITRFSVSRALRVIRTATASDGLVVLCVHLGRFASAVNLLE
jgi:hypothetical protein